MTLLNVVLQVSDPMAIKRAVIDPTGQDAVALALLLLVLTSGLVIWEIVPTTGANVLHGAVAYLFVIVVISSGIQGDQTFCALVLFRYFTHHLRLFNYFIHIYLNLCLAKATFVNARILSRF